VGGGVGDAGVILSVDVPESARIGVDILSSRGHSGYMSTIVRAKALTTTPSQQLVRIWFDVKDIQQQTDAGTVVFGYRMSRRSHAKGALYMIPGATPDSILAAVGGAK
jgi:hypothetical protein